MNRFLLAGLLPMLLAAMLAGCETLTTTSSEPTPDSTSVTGNSTDPRNRAKIHTELASLYFERGNMAVVLDELRIAVSADPTYALAYSMFGLVYTELREYKLAETNFERALRLAPNDADINHNYGGFLCQTGRENESIKYFLQAVRNPLYKQPARSYSAAGVCSLRKDKVKEAEDFFLRSLRLDPDDAVSMLNLGQIRYRQGNLEEARKLVLRYNKMGDATAESLWLALRVERKLGERVAEQGYANQLRRRFSGSREFQLLQRGEYD